MKPFSASEAILIEEVTQAAQRAKETMRGLSIGYLVRLIRSQLGMSQKALAKRAGVPQSTVSRIEQGQKDANLSTLHKVLNALSCNLVVIPMLQESIGAIRLKQARKQAAQRVQYLKGTMSLEKQQPDSRLIEELLKQEENRLLQGSGSELWEDRR